jgi:arginase family enzyme
MPIEFEEIKMSKSLTQDDDVLIQDYTVDYESDDFTTSEDESDLKLNRQSALLQHAKSVKMQTYQALKDGFYPIVLGGDNTQGLGSVPAMKQYMPQAKLLWIDSNEEPSQTNMTLAKLSGRSVPEGYSQLSCLKDRDITIFGQADIDLSTKQELVFGA